MDPVLNPPLPGSMTVAPLFGWEAILTVLAGLLALAVVFFVVSVCSRSADNRAEWQAGLTARSRDRRDPIDEPPAPRRPGPGQVRAADVPDDAPRR